LLQDRTQGTEGHKRGASSTAAAKPVPAYKGLGVGGFMPVWWDLTALCSVDASDGHLKQAGRWDNPGLASYCRTLATQKLQM